MIDEMVDLNCGTKLYRIPPCSSGLAVLVIFRARRGAPAFCLQSHREEYEHVALSDRPLGRFKPTSLDRARD